MLHTINKSPFTSDALQSCLRLARPQSAILFYEDGVYATAKNTQVSATIQHAVQSFKVFALEADLTARGIGSQRMLKGIQVINYSEFVELTIQYKKVMAWL